MKKTQQGFTLIELMIVVAIIGILAAIAVPAFREYMAVSHGGAAMKGAASYASKAAACVQTGIGCVSLNAEDGTGGFSLSAAFSQDDFTQTFSYDDGDCQVTGTMGANGDITYSAVSTGGGATTPECQQGAGL